MFGEPTGSNSEFSEIHYTQIKIIYWNENFPKVAELMQTTSQTKQQHSSPLVEEKTHAKVRTQVAVLFEQRIASCCMGLYGFCIVSGPQ